jgi:DNA-binding NarL/FixJ family response regulator
VTPQSVQSASNEIRIRLNAPLLRTLLEMAASVATPLEAFAGQILEARIADFRLQKIIKDSPFPLRGECRSIQHENCRQKVNAKRKRILQMLDEGVRIDDIARRTGSSPSTVRRVKHGRERSDADEEI